jgi:hypothetical protein
MHFPTYTIPIELIKQERRNSNSSEGMNSGEKNRNIIFQKRSQ